MRIRLTDLAVKKLPLSSEGQVTYWDELTPNFGIRCSTRSKSYIVLLGEKRRRKTLGRYPGISLADARKQAKLLMSQDAHLPDQTSDYDVQMVVHEYIADCKGRVRPTTMKGYQLYLEGITFSGPIGRITQNDVLKALKKHTGPVAV